MERVRDNARPFSMLSWQKGTPRYAFSGCQPADSIYTAVERRTQYAKTEHECNTACCFAGWLALSPEWQAQGGTVGFAGVPVFGVNAGPGAVAQFLGVSSEVARSLTGIGSLAVEDFPAGYGKALNQIVPQDIIDRLNELLVRGESTEAQNEPS